MRQRRPRMSLAAVLAAAALVGGGSQASAAVVIAGGQPARDGPRVLAETPATPMDKVATKANNSPEILADPTDERFVAMAHRQDAPAFACALQVSGDGGRSWVGADFIHRLPAGADECYAPDIAFDGDGRLYFLFVGLAGAGHEPMGVFLVTSDDHAQTFTAPRKVLGPHNFSVRMAIDPDMGERGRLHLVWLHASSDPPLGGFGPPPNPVLAAHSDDGGRTFSKPVQASDRRRQRVVAPSLALGPDHAVHVAYYDLRDDVRDYQGLEGPTFEETWSLVVATSSDGGRRFSPGVVVDDDIAPAERLMVVFTAPPPAVVAGGTHVCVAWTDARHGDADAFASCSPDRRRRFGQPVRLNDDRVGNGRSQYQPQLSMSPGGRIDAVFYDRRRSIQNLHNDVSFTYSEDSGKHFAPNMTLNGRQSSLVRIGPEYAIPSAKGQVEFGSRIGLWSTDDSAVAAWTDTRNHVELTIDQDIFATKVVDLQHRRIGVPWSGTLGGGLVFAAAAGICALIMLRRWRSRLSEASI